jgi:hypothetical protein
MTEEVNAFAVQQRASRLAECREDIHVCAAPHEVPNRPIHQKGGHSFHLSCSCSISKVGNAGGFPAHPHFALWIFFTTSVAGSLLATATMSQNSPRPSPASVAEGFFEAWRKGHREGAPRPAWGVAESYRHASPANTSSSTAIRSRTTDEQLEAMIEYIKPPLMRRLATGSK